MLPWVASESYQVLGLTLRTWGTFVAAGYALGTFLAWRRAKKRGMDADFVLDLAFWIFFGAFFGARLFHVVLYEPSYYLAHPWEAIDPRRPGYAMFGGLIGAAAVFFWKIFRDVHHQKNWIAYADTLVWGVPWGCGIGRIGCFLIHDHPGTLTHFVLGVRYPDGSVRHDLGLYLSFVGFLTGGLFLFWNRHERRSGFWLGSFMIMEGIARFVLDFLRVADVRYFGLTPTQYFALPLAVGGWMLVRKKRNIEKKV